MGLGRDKILQIGYKALKAEKEGPVKEYPLIHNCAKCDCPAKDKAKKKAKKEEEAKLSASDPLKFLAEQGCDDVFCCFEC